MLKKIYNRFRKSIEHFRGEKPNIIKWANFLAEITKASKIKRLKNDKIKQKIDTQKLNCLIKSLNIATSYFFFYFLKLHNST